MPSARRLKLAWQQESISAGDGSNLKDKSGKCLTKKQKIRSRWTEYCSENCINYESRGDNAVLKSIQPPEEDLQPILREEVEIAVASLKKGTIAII